MYSYNVENNQNPLSQTPTQQIVQEQPVVQPTTNPTTPQNNILFRCPATFIEGGFPDKIRGGVAGAAALAQQYIGGTLYVLADRIEFINDANTPMFNIPLSNITQIQFIKKVRVFRLQTPNGSADILMKKSDSRGAKVVKPLRSRLLAHTLPVVLGMILLSIISASASIGVAVVTLLVILCFVALPIYVFMITKKIKQESQQLRTVLEKFIKVTNV